MHDHVESNGTRASKIPQIQHCRNDNNFKVKVIQHAEASNPHNKEILYHETACMSLERRERSHKKEATLNRKAFHGHKQGNFNATD